MKVGVIGAGTMGSGIAQAFAQTEGYEVCLCDINDEFAANGKNKIAKGFEKRIAKGKMDQAIVIEEKLFGDCFETEDQKAGMGNFLEKDKEKKLKVVPFQNK